MTSTNVNKNGANAVVSSSTNVYARTGTSWSRVNYIKVYNGANWVQVYQYDSTAPTINSSRTTTGLSNGNMRFAWSGGALATDSESGVASVKIQVQYTPWAGSGEGWSDWYSLSSLEWSATSGSFDFTPSTSKRVQWSTSYPFSETVSKYYLGFRVVATDNVGNTATSSEIAAFTKPYGTFTAWPNDSANLGQDSYQTGVAFYGLTTHGVRCGDGSSAGGLNWAYGCFFYNTKLADACLGYAPDSGDIYVQRYQSSGVSGTNYFQPHNLTFSNGATGATFSGAIVGANLTGTDASATITFDSSWLAPIAAGTARGIGLVRNGSTSYHVLRNILEDLSGSGQIHLYFT